MTEKVILVVYATINRDLENPKTRYINLPRFVGIPEFRGFLLCPGALSTKSKKADRVQYFQAPGIPMRGRSQPAGGMKCKPKTFFTIFL